MRSIITAATLISPDRRIDRPIVLMEDGMIEAITSAETAEVPAAGRHLEYADATLVPAFFDIHMHGGKGHDLMKPTADALDSIGMFLAARGVGAYLATTATAPVDSMLQSIQGLARQIERNDHPGAMPIAIHLEGPFFSCAKRGVQPPENLQAPSIALFDRFLEAANGHLALMTIAPELEGALELIAHATGKGIRVSLGHSNADTQAALDGIAAGATSATHTFNAMRALDHRNPGLLGIVLDREDLYAEIICDGIHVNPRIVRLFWKAKGAQRSILVTDAISAAGMPDGKYPVGPLRVTVENGVCRYQGTLAGSALTMDKALRNWMDFTQCGLQDAVRCASTNPANMLGLGKTHGTLEPGRSANITVLTPQKEVAATLLNGLPVIR